MTKTFNCAWVIWILLRANSTGACFSNMLQQGFVNDKEVLCILFVWPAQTDLAFRLPNGANKECLIVPVAEELQKNITVFP